MSPAPMLQELFDYIRARSYPVSFFELLAAWPYDRPKLRSRVCLLVKQGFLEKVEGDSFIVAGAYI